MSTQTIYNTLMEEKSASVDKNNILTILGFYDLLESTSYTTLTNGDVYIETNGTIDSLTVSTSNKIQIGELRFADYTNTYLYRGIADGGIYNAELSMSTTFTVYKGNKKIFQICNQHTYGNFIWPTLSTLKDVFYLHYDPYTDDEIVPENERCFTIDLKQYVSVSNGDNKNIFYLLEKDICWIPTYDENGVCTGSRADTTQMDNINELEAINKLSLNNGILYLQVPPNYNKHVNIIIRAHYFTDSDPVYAYIKPLYIFVVLIPEDLPKINLKSIRESVDSDMATAGVCSSYYVIHDTLTPTNFIKITSNNIPNNFENTLSEYYKIPKDFNINRIEDKIKQNEIELYAVSLNHENDENSSIYIDNYFEGNDIETFSYNSTLNKCSVSINNINNNTIKFVADANKSTEHEIVSHGYIEQITSGILFSYINKNNQYEFLLPKPKLAEINIFNDNDDNNENTYYKLSFNLYYEIKHPTPIF